MANKKDCYAFVTKDKCFALTKMDCEGCTFYKQSKNPKLDRAKIVRSCENYAYKYNKANA